MIGCIIVTHGYLADAMVDAACGILGTLDGVYTITVSTLPAPEIYRKMKEIVEENDSKSGFLVLASLKGGSCWNAGLKLAREFPNVAVVSGVNLSMLISVLNKRDTISLAQLAETACQDGTRGIDCYPGQPNK